MFQERGNTLYKIHDKTMTRTPFVFERLYLKNQARGGGERGQRQ